MGGSPPHPSLIPEDPSTYQPARHLIRGQRAALGSLGQWSPNTVLFSVEVNATILGAFHRLSPAIVVSFSAYPLSAVLQYIYLFIILFTFIDLFHKVHSHHTFTFLSLPQFLASPVIFTNWGKQGVTPTIYDV
jgi:hypothetical protein